MSFKTDYIAKHGEEAYANRLRRRQIWGQKLPGGEKQRSQDRRDADPEKAREYDRASRERNPEKVKAKGKKISRKGGAYYKEHMQYRQTGIQGEREKIRCAHGNQWRPFKRIIAPESQIHHQWRKDSSEYDGVALVEAKAHQYGIIDVIQILDGKITLLTEEQMKRTKRKIKEE